MLFDEADALAVLPKAVAAANKLRVINSGVKVTAEVAEVGRGNAERLAAGTQLVLDAITESAKDGRWVKVKQA